MRDNHEGLPEILDAYERDGYYFGVVQIDNEGDPVAFEFGIDPGGYRALRRVLQERPFETTVVGPYRYFFVPTVHRLSEEGISEFKVRIEQGKEGRQFPFHGPQSLVSNLVWFFELKDLNAAAHLRQVPPLAADRQSLDLSFDPMTVESSVTQVAVGRAPTPNGSRVSILILDDGANRELRMTAGTRCLLVLNGNANSCSVIGFAEDGVQGLDSWYNSVADAKRDLQAYGVLEEDWVDAPEDISEALRFAARHFNFRYK